MKNFRPLKDSVDDGFTPYDISVDIEWIADVKGESSQWTVLIWISLTWFDNRLTWNISEYNISKISLPGNTEVKIGYRKKLIGRKVWTPDLRHQEIVGAEQIDLSKEILVVHSNGKVEGQGLFFKSCRSR